MRMANDDQKYDLYSTADFLDDADFIRYVKHRPPDDELRWNTWLAGSPPNRAAFDEAYAALLAMLSIVRLPPPAGSVEESWAAVTRQIEAAEKRGRVRMLVRWSAAAAVILAVLVSSGYWYYQDKITVRTAYGEQRRIVLPDGSVVLLNANSSLSWHRAWAWRPGRQVWISGEALFDVIPGHPGDNPNATAPFIAQAADVSVAVLGTRFNIRERRNTVVVSLLSGKVRVTSGRPNGQPVVLTPGEELTVDDTSTRMGRIDRMTNQPQAWTTHQIKANGMTVADIIAAYEDTYGHRIVLGDPRMAYRRIDGTLSLATSENVIYTLANILNVDVIRSGDTLILRPK